MNHADADRLDLAWYIDKLVQVLVFVGGISAIVFIFGIFVFITREGLGFIVGELDLIEFFTSPRWMPTSFSNPTYGALALILTGAFMFTTRGNEWIACLTIAAILELYTAFRIPQEEEKEKS